MTEQQQLSAVEKACAILRDIEEHPQDTSNAAMCRRLGLNPSSVSRIILTMLDIGAVARDARGYRVTFREITTDQCPVPLPKERFSHSKLARFEWWFATKVLPGEQRKVQISTSNVRFFLAAARFVEEHDR